MLSRSTLSQIPWHLVCRQCRARPVSTRGLTSAAPGSFQYSVGDVDGVKFASRDLPGPTTTLAVIAKAGTRYQPFPGFSEGLERFAFMSTERRSCLRITREVELLGGDLYTFHSRENLVLGSKFLRNDLPYFTELLSEVISKTKFSGHELDEEVIRTINLAQKAILQNPLELAINSAHTLAFHRGIGTSLHPTSPSSMKKYLDVDNLKRFSHAAYAKPNFAIVGNGVNSEELSQWIGEFFKDVPRDSPERLQLKSEPSKYYGGEERIASGAGNAMVIGFPGSSSKDYKPEIAVLAALLGGESNIKWTPGFSLFAKAVAPFPGAHASTTNATYSDAGLLYATITGTAHDVRKASIEMVKAIKSVAAGKVNGENIQKAIAIARFKALEADEDSYAELEVIGASLVQTGKVRQIDEVAKGIDSVSAEAVKNAAKSMLDGKATVSTVGDLFILPFAAELELNV